MTHEQKPESAEFRTREAQEKARFPANGSKLFAIHINTYRRDILVAEARGAAEQRRKDAEGCIQVHQYFMGGFWNDCSPEMYANQPHRRVLYTRPANVAALEDRVKELEGEICSIKDRIKDAASSVMGIKTEAMNGDNLAITLASYFEDVLGERDANGWPPEAQKACDEIEAAIVAHMGAAIREGGEHG